MGSNAQRRREARERVQQMRREEAARQRRRSTLLGVGLAVLVVLAIGGIAWAVQVGSKEDAPVAIDGVETFEYTAGQHTDSDVKYSEDPPVGGEHDDNWQTCDIYDQPIRDENAVHSLEHGAVWITYDPTLPQADIDSLTGRFGDNYLLMSPRPGQEAPVVATAWNNQLTLDSVDDPRLDAFVTKFRQGEQTPEPLATCDGGVTDTVAS
jgi:hypothetical protein